MISLLWLTGCYRSHLCPLAVCKTSDICVYIKEGTDGRQRWRKWCVKHLRVSSTTGVWEDREREWPSPNKDVCSSSASLGFQFEAKFEAEEREWVGVGMNGGLWMCACVRICTVPQMGWAYVCGFQCLGIVFFSTLAVPCKPTHWLWNSYTLTPINEKQNYNKLKSWHLL